MMRACEQCGRQYEARHGLSKTCGDACRKARSRGKPSSPDVIVQNDAPVMVGLVDSTVAALDAAGRLNSVAGQQALRIAQAMTGRETGSSLASLSKELSAVMALALAGVPVAGDSIDELKVRREARRAG